MNRTTFSVVVPCYNEEATLERSVSGLIAAFEGESSVDLEVVIVDDCSTDVSVEIATRLKNRHKNVRLIQHQRNLGKGATLRTGFKSVTGDVVGIHDADLEYDPQDLLKLLDPLIKDEAEVVYGSRFLSGSAHRVLYFWHSVGNSFLTLLSNMFTDLNLSDMETCYKLFKREVIEQIDIKEDRFGFEPEVTAKIAALRVRIFEIGISYYGRTYEEGKKIGMKDGFRALYCILRYNGHRAPIFLQLFIYSLIGGLCAIFNLIMFSGMRAAGLTVDVSVATAFVIAALLNYLLCIVILFRHKARWNTPGEAVVYLGLVAVAGILDITITKGLIWSGIGEVVSKATSSFIGLAINFAGRRFFVFPEPGSGPWRAQVQKNGFSVRKS